MFLFLISILFPINVYTQEYDCTRPLANTTAITVLSASCGVKGYHYNCSYTNETTLSCLHGTDTELMCIGIIGPHITSTTVLCVPLITVESGGSSYKEAIMYGLIGTIGTIFAGMYVCAKPNTPKEESTPKSYQTP
jgi:hypothetical protein